jgi:hypothetical protein
MMQAATRGLPAIWVWCFPKERANIYRDWRIALLVEVSREFLDSYDDHFKFGQVAHERSPPPVLRRVYMVLLRGPALAVILYHHCRSAIASRAASAHPGPSHE